MTDLRWVSPPGWPPAPPGWRPPDDWQPDPSWPRAPGGWQFWQPKPQRRRSTVPRWVWIVLCVGALAVVGMVVSSASDGPSKGPGAAYSVCRSFVKDRLKAPTTADFPFDPDGVTGADGHWTVRSHVDAENSFGAKIRNTFACTVTWDHGNSWRLDSLTGLNAS